MAPSSFFSSEASAMKEPFLDGSLAASVDAEAKPISANGCATEKTTKGRGEDEEEIAAAESKQGFRRRQRRRRGWPPVMTEDDSQRCGSPEGCNGLEGGQQQAVAVDWGDAGVALAALTCYANSVSFGFAFDDAAAVLNNRDVTGSGSSSRWSSLFTHDFWGAPMSERSHKSYRPLTVLTFRAQHVLAGGGRRPSPAAFHAVNVLLHVLVVLLFKRLCRRVCGGRASPTLAAALFAVHPVSKSTDVHSEWGRSIWEIGRRPREHEVSVAFLIDRTPSCLSLFGRKWP